jgi:hypothetical protein
LAFDNLRLHQPKHGIVIHGIPKSDLNIEDEKANCQHLEELNLGITGGGGNRAGLGTEPVPIVKPYINKKSEGFKSELLHIHKTEQSAFRDEDSNQDPL